MTEILSRPFIPELLIIFSLVLILREFFVLRDIIPAKYILTPLVTVTVLATAVYSLFVADPETYRVLIVCSLILALVADTLLMIVEVNLLPYGLVFFLGAHLLYIAAFMKEYAFFSWHLVPAGILVVLLLISGIVIARKAGKLAVPVIIYSFVIALMVFFAVAGEYGSMDRKSFVVTGAILFLLSDTILAVNAFYRPVPKSSVWVWALYGPSQMLITLSCFA